MNHCIFSGRLGADPEIKVVGENTSLCRFSIAVSRPYKDKKTGERGTDWVQCTAWGKTAEMIHNMFKKGDGIQVLCEYNCDKVEDKYYHKFKVDRFTFPVSTASKTGDAGESQQAADDNSDLPF